MLGSIAGEDEVRHRVDELAGSGQRVLLLARGDAPLDGEELPPGLRPKALAMFEEEIRSDAAETMRYFGTQDVRLKVISGDNPRTVGSVARRVQIPDGGEAVDARTLPDDPVALAEVLEASSVFGRVTPNQKRAFVAALQSRHHVVAMTGDGVNDALALKDADVGVAMGNGAPATRAVAQLVLLDGRFSHMPSVVAEGRRVISNIERVASLFLIKNVYSALLALAVAVAGVPYPFLPRHLTVVSALTIGIPAFFLSLAPGGERYRPGFLRRVATVSLPAGFITATAVFVAYALARAAEAQPDEARTSACVVAMVIGLRVLLLVSRPLVPWKVALVASMGGLFVLLMAIPAARQAFRLGIPLDLLAEALAIGALGAVAVGLVWRVALRRAAAHEAEP